MKKDTKKESFTLPEGYFEERKTALKKLAKAPPKRSPVLRRLSWSIAAAAALAALVLLLRPGEMDDSENIKLHELSQNEILSFLEKDQYAVHWWAQHSLSAQAIDSLFSDEAPLFNEEEVYQFLSNEPLENYNL